MRPLEPVQRIRRWHTYLVVWRVHGVLGLAAGALLLVLSLTGSLLVLHHDVERRLGPPYRVIGYTDTGADPAAWNPMIGRAAAVAPAGARPYRLLPPAAPDETVQLMFLAADGRTRWSAFADPRDGRLLWHGPDQALFTPWLLQLHMTLHLGPWGYAITGAAGAGLLALGLTGLYLHRTDLASLWRRPPWRWGRNWRAFLHDTHTWVGAASLYFSVVLGATGLAFAILILPGQLRKRPAAPDGPVPWESLAPLEPLTAAAQAALPGQELVRVSFPVTAGAPIRLLFLDRSAPVWAKFSTADFEPTTGELRQIRRGREASAAAKWRALVGPLHFGFYGAPWVKAAYAIGGLAPGLLALTGAAIWFRRTRRPRRRT